MKNFIFIILLLSLSACGFKPLYQQVNQDNETIAQQLSDIKIDRINNDRAGQILHNYLLDALNPRGRNQSSILNLRTKLSLSTIESGLKRDSTANIYKINARADYELYHDDKIYKNFTTNLSASFAADRLSNYATDVAISNAQQNILKTLSQEMRNKISLYLSSNPDLNTE